MIGKSVILRYDKRACFYQRSAMENHQKTILFAVTIAPTIDVLMAGQIEWLVDQGFSVRTCSSGTPTSPNQIDENRYQHFEIDMTRTFSPLRDLKNLFQWFQVVHRVKPDVLVASTPKAALISLVAGFLLRVPNRIYLLRGLRLETMRGWRRTILWCCERICAMTAHSVIAVSSSVGKEFISLHLASPRKVSTIGSGSSNGVNSKKFHPLPSDIRLQRRADLKFSDSDIVVAFIGRLVADKGWDIYCQAVERVQQRYPNVKAIAMGSNEENLTVPSGIQYFGVQKNLENWYQVIDVLLLPTFREGFPNVPIEAAACEVPTIASRATGAIDSVVDGVTGLLVNVGDVDATISALVKLVENPELRNSLGKNARIRAVEEFNPESVWQGYLLKFKERL